MNQLPMHETCKPDRSRALHRECHDDDHRRSPSPHTSECGAAPRRLTQPASRCAPSPPSPPRLTRTPRATVPCVTPTARVAERANHATKMQKPLAGQKKTCWPFYRLFRACFWNDTCTRSFSVVFKSSRRVFFLSLFSSTRTLGNATTPPLPTLWRTAPAPRQRTRPTRRGGIARLPRKEERNRRLTRRYPPRKPSSKTSPLIRAKGPNTEGRHKNDFVLER